jgi:GDPmannose 4,6-dehydratase
MATALVTGITGQDGGYLAEQLVGEGWHVHGAVRRDESLPNHLLALGDALTCTEVDLLDASSVEALLEKADPIEVYNFAGASSVAQSWQDPLLTARVNGEVVAMLLELLWRRRERGRPVQFLQASSAEIFAGAATSPQDESTRLSPRNPYGASKAYAHHLVHIYRGRGLHAVNAILYNHESPRRPASFVTRKITSAVAAIADGRETELVLGNMDARRDWGWAPEYVNGMTLALRHDNPDDWVFATGKSISVAEFVAAAFAHIGVDEWQQYVRRDSVLARAGDAAELVGDATRARAILRWPQTVGLHELVARMVDADRSNQRDIGA